MPYSQSRVLYVYHGPHATQLSDKSAIVQNIKKVKDFVKMKDPDLCKGPYHLIESQKIILESAP
jgi:hypothetical protein